LRIKTRRAYVQLLLPNTLLLAILPALLHLLPVNLVS